MTKRTEQVRAHRVDVVTWERVLSSACARDGLLMRLAESQTERASFERDTRFRVSRRDHLDDVKIGAVPEWERALMHVVVVQDLVRILDGRLRCGAPLLGRLTEQTEVLGLLGAPVEPATGTVEFIAPYVEDNESEEPTRDEHAAYLEALAAEESGYEHDPGEANGGVSAHDVNPVLDDPNRLLKPRSPRGIEAFSTVQSIGAVPEVAWFFSASAAELGMNSSFNAQLVEKLKLGVAVTGASGAAPEGPTLDQIQAATRQRTVRQRLGTLAVHHQADIELAYTDRRYDNPALVSPYGPGCAPLVWRAAERAGDVQVEKSGKAYVKPGKATLRELVRDARRDWPTYSPPEKIHGRKATLQDRIRHAAELILWTAHEHYRIASGLPTPPKRKQRRRRTRPDLVVAGTSGSKRRRLVEAPRKVATEAA